MYVVTLKMDRVKHIAFIGSKVTEQTQSAVFSGGEIDIWSPCLSVIWGLNGLFRAAHVPVE